MKAFISFGIVLAWTAMAGGALTLGFNDDFSGGPFEITVGETVEISVYCDSTGACGGWIGISDVSLGRWGNVSIPEPPVCIDPPCGPCWGGFCSFESDPWDPAHPPVPGKVFCAEYEALAPGDSVIALYEFDGVSIYESITIHQVPEPGMIGLLALGAVMLRRR